MKIIVFDLGGTLMEYRGMPYLWVDYYKNGFEKIAKDSSLDCSTYDIEKSIEIMKSFNPRVKYREHEFPPEFIFEKTMSHWKEKPPIDRAIQSFFNGMKLEPVIYNDTIPTLKKLKKQGYLIATLTDLPTAMPDWFFKKDINSLLGCFDLYVSSLSCGYRKPNKGGLALIAQKLNVDINEIVYVGDEEKDELTAKNANCRFILIDRNRIGKREGVHAHNLSDVLELL